MLIINLNNIEDLIFLDKKVHQLLPDMNHILEQWMLGKRIPFLRSQRQQAVLDMLNGLKDHHVKILEAYFKNTILLDTLCYSATKNIVSKLNDNFENELSEEIKDFTNMAVSRDAESIYISFWR